MAQPNTPPLKSHANTDTHNNNNNKKSRHREQVNTLQFSYCTWPNCTKTSLFWISWFFRTSGNAAALEITKKGGSRPYSLPSWTSRSCHWLPWSERQLKIIISLVFINIKYPLTRVIIENNIEKNISLNFLRAKPKARGMSWQQSWTISSCILEGYPIFLKDSNSNILSIASNWTEAPTIAPHPFFSLTFIQTYSTWDINQSHAKQITIQVALTDIMV